ncbi:MAG: hypothetical protein KatS3mg125_0249 [Lysobacterales bacterium]|jgi:hypothetical protein|nr:MAG: hypothetical protein KatS3mg125_0249 [Xanthomonadales bacterium]
MSRSPSPFTSLRLRIWALAAVGLIVLILGLSAGESQTASQSLAERVTSPAVESISEEGWLRLRWQSLLPGMMK